MPPDVCDLPPPALDEPLFEELLPELPQPAVRAAAASRAGMATSRIGTRDLPVGVTVRLIGRRPGRIPSRLPDARGRRVPSVRTSSVAGAYPATVPRRLDERQLGEHVGRLYRTACGLCGTPEDAEDLVQETYARVLARPRLLHGDDDVGYLLGVLRNTFVSSLRSRGRRVGGCVAIDDRSVADLSTAHRPDRMAEARAVFAAIASLPAEFRDALVAVDVAGLSYREASDLLGIVEATVASRLHRARARVIAQLEPSERQPAGDSSLAR